LKRMGAPPGACNEEGTFTLQNHREQNLSTEESIEQIAQYFAHISQEYPPLDPQSLPQRVRDILNSPDPLDIPQLSKIEKTQIRGPRRLTEKTHRKVLL
jgi:hypothetical protein